MNNLTVSDPAKKLLEYYGIKGDNLSCIAMGIAHLSDDRRLSAYERVHGYRPSLETRKEHRRTIVEGIDGLREFMAEKSREWRQSAKNKASIARVAAVGEVSASSLLRGVDLTAKEKSNLVATVLGYNSSRKAALSQDRASDFRKGLKAVVFAKECKLPTPSRILVSLTWFIFNPLVIKAHGESIKSRASDPFVSRFKQSPVKAMVNSLDFDEVSDALTCLGVDSDRYLTEEEIKELTVVNPSDRVGWDRPQVPRRILINYFAYFN